MKKIRKFKKGAASFYIVAISTLILVIIAASFAAVIISEITRTSNDDLAQSAYDSALAGVEDAKLAYYNYQSCKEGASNVNSGLSCEDIINWVEKGTLDGYESCDMVAAILGRYNADSKQSGVLVQESSEAGNNMQQAYTCVTVTNKTDDVADVISESNPSFTVRVKFDGSVNGEVLDEIKKVKVKWHSDKDDEAATGTKEYANFEGDGGLFGEKTPVPAVIAVGMVQTAKSFNLSDFDVTKDGATDRGTVYLVPYKDDDTIKDDDTRYEKAVDGNVPEEGMLKSNDKTPENKPFAVKCDGDEYACEATIEIPRPVGDNAVRNEDTFVFRVSLPYGGPTTHFSLEFYCADDVACSAPVNSEAAGESETGVPNSGSSLAVLDGVQVKIDSTGRANDLYRRVETRLMPEDTTYPYPLYAIQVLGNDNNSLINKDLSPTCENNFIDVSNCD